MRPRTIKVARACAIVGLSLTALIPSGPTASASAAAGHPVEGAPLPRAQQTRSFPSDGFPAYNLGMLPDAPSVQGRDAGFSTLIGGQSLWAFGDTFLTQPASDGTMARTNTPGFNVPGYLPSGEPTDATGAPSQLIPFSSAEITYNQTHTDGSRYAVWPGGIIERDGEGLIFWGRKRLTATQQAVAGTAAMGIITVAAGTTSTGTTVRPSGSIMGGEDCEWFSPYLAPDGYVYFNTVLNQTGLDNCPVRTSLVQPIGVARAPLASVETKSTWRYWNGTTSTWATSPLSTTAILHTLTTTTSMAWNETLDKYLMITGILTSSQYFTADAPQGPWSPSDDFVTPLAPDPAGDTGSYYFIQHEEHASTDDGVILVHYTRPKQLPGFPFRSETRLLAVDLRSGAGAHLDDYIVRAYQAFMGYTPGTTDINYWAGEIEDRTLSIPSFLSTLATSQDGLEHLVKSTYLEVLGRPADTGGLAYWTDQLDEHGWGHAGLVARLANMEEYSGDYPSNTSFVQAVYPLTLGRAADGPGLTYWTGQLNAGVSRYNVVWSLMNTAEAGRRQAKLAYEALLEREAEDVEATYVASRDRESTSIRQAVMGTPEAIGLT